MKRYLGVFMAAAGACIAGGATLQPAGEKAGQKMEHAPMPDVGPLAQLEGRWCMADPEKVYGPRMAEYRVTASGTAVVETLFPGSEHEMVSVYTKDKKTGALLMTHYCGLGNQPRMRSTGIPVDGKLRFEFVDGGNMASRDELHMDSLVLTITDKDHIRHEWSLYKDGKVVDTKVFDLVRAPVPR
jgi:hypothetical protein